MTTTAKIALTAAALTASLLFAGCSPTASSPETVPQPAPVSASPSPTPSASPTTTCGDTPEFLDLPIGDLATFCNGITVQIEAIDDNVTMVTTEVEMTFVVTNTSDQVWRGIDTQVQVGHGSELTTAEEPIDNDEIGATLVPDQKKIQPNRYFIPVKDRDSVTVLVTLDQDPGNAVVFTGNVNQG